MIIEDVIIDLGWEVIGPATRLSEAMVLAREEGIDAALLDVNLDGEMSWDAASILQDRGIPFIFTTGYDSATVLLERFARQPVVSKPFKAEDIERALHTLLGQPCRPFLHEPLLPAPHACLGRARPPRDLAGANPVGAQQHDLGSPDLLLRSVTILGDPFETLSVRGREVDD